MSFVSRCCAATIMNSHGISFQKDSILCFDRSQPWFFCLGNPPSSLYTKFPCLWLFPSSLQRKRRVLQVCSCGKVCCMEEPTVTTLSPLLNDTGLWSSITRRILAESFSMGSLRLERRPRQQRHDNCIQSLNLHSCLLRQDDIVLAQSL